jgi:hypothetical protein
MEQIGDLPPSDSLPQIADVAFDERDNSDPFQIEL